MVNIFWLIKKLILFLNCLTFKLYYYLLLFEDTNSALFVPYVENVATH